MRAVSSFMGCRAGALRRGLTWPVSNLVWAGGGLVFALMGSLEATPPWRAP